MPDYTLTVRPLSPVHVGTGELLSADEYIVRRQGDDCFLHTLDPARFFGNLTGDLRAEFDRLVDAGGQAALRQFFDRNVDPARHARWSAAASPDLFDRYQDDLRSASSQLEVHPITRTGTVPRPYLPGSSVKGAVRTAVIQHLIEQDPQLARNAEHAAGGNPRFADRDVETAVLGNQRRNGRPDLRADPFRAVRFSDCLLPDDATSIDPVDLVSLKRQGAQADPGGILMFYEMTFSALDGEDVPAAGTLTIDAALTHADARRARGSEFDHPVSRVITADDMLAACNAFYGANLADEAERVRDARPDLAGAWDDLLARVNGLGDDEAPLRLGRFSHVECVTLAPPLRRASGGRSRGLAAGQLPMGWTAIRLQTRAR